MEADHLTLLIVNAGQVLLGVAAVISAIAAHRQAVKAARRLEQLDRVDAARARTGDGPVRVPPA